MIHTREVIIIMIYDEIIKALECCGSDKADSCLNCPLFYDTAIQCAKGLCIESLNLIKSQKEEIERLNKRVNNLEESELFREANDY